jgi:hypothetical protein
LIPRFGRQGASRCCHLPFFHDCSGIRHSSNARIVNLIGATANGPRTLTYSSFRLTISSSSNSSSTVRLRPHRLRRQSPATCWMKMGKRSPASGCTIAFVTTPKMSTWKRRNSTSIMFRRRLRIRTDGSSCGVWCPASSTCWNTSRSRIATAGFR